MNCREVHDIYTFLSMDLSGIEVAWKPSADIERSRGNGHCRGQDNTVHGAHIDLNDALQTVWEGEGLNGGDG